VVEFGLDQAMTYKEFTTWCIQSAEHSKADKYTKMLEVFLWYCKYLFVLSVFVYSYSMAPV
jgi:hypothetical protein